MLVVVALNTIHQKRSLNQSCSFLLPQVSLPCTLCHPQRGGVNFKFNLGWSLSFGMGLAGVPAC